MFHALDGCALREPAMLKFLLTLGAALTFTMVVAVLA